MPEFNFERDKDKIKEANLRASVLYLLPYCIFLEVNRDGPYVLGVIIRFCDKRERGGLPELN
jgi:hypothetical protein